MSLTLAKDGWRTGDTTRRILIVEDSAAMARCLSGIAKNFGRVTVEATVSGALEQLARHSPWIAFIVDLGLPDGSGVEVVARIRARDRNVPGLILTGNHGHDAINAAFDLRVQYLAKPATHAQIEQFLASISERPLNSVVLPSVSSRTRALPEPLVLPRGPERNIAEQVETLAKTCSLTAIEVDLVDACLHGFSRKEYVEAHGVSVNTYKKRVRSALRKLAASSLDEVRDRLLRSL